MPGARVLSRRVTLQRICALACGLPFSAALRAQGGADEPQGLARIDDLRPLAEQVRRQRIPLLLFFSTPGCPYCREVRQNYLAPRLSEDAGRLLIREVDIVSDRRLVGLAGERLTEAQFAARFDVRTAPVVQLVDARLTPLGRPLVGIGAAGFYESYLSAAIEQAQRVLRERTAWDGAR